MNAIMSEVINDPDGGAYQICPCVVVGKDGSIEIIEQATSLEETCFWGVYRKDVEKDGLWQWFADFGNRERALEFVFEMLELRRLTGFSAGEACSMFRKPYTVSAV